MADAASAKHRDRLWRVLTLVLLGVGIHLLAPQFAQMPHLLAVLRAMSWPWLAAAIVMQILSYIGSGYLLIGLTASPDERISLPRSMGITLGAGTVGMVAGGVVGYTAAMAGWLRAVRVERDQAVLAAPLEIQLNNVTVLLAALVGLVHLLGAHALTAVEAASFVIIMLAVAAVLVAMLLGRRHPDRIAALLTRGVLPPLLWLQRLWRRLAPHLHMTASFSDGEEGARLQARLAAVLGIWDRLSGHGWTLPLAGAIANILFDMLCLLALFHAAGHPVGLGTLLIGYGLPLLLGKVSILPGGVGVVELSMTALYSSLGVPHDVLVVVVLVYRFLSFWLPTLLGLLVLPFLRGRTGRLQV